jgi:hypothetical protein
MERIDCAVMGQNSGEDRTGRCHQSGAARNCPGHSYFLSVISAISSFTSISVPNGRDDAASRSRM